MAGRIEEAGMAQLDDDRRLGDEEPQGQRAWMTTPSSSSPPTMAPKSFTWPDGGQTPFAQSKGTVYEGGFRVPAILRWPGHVPADTVRTASSPGSTGCRPS
jgi:arylsulfatase A-like enzyme